MLEALGENASSLTNKEPYRFQRRMCRSYVALEMRQLVQKVLSLQDQISRVVRSRQDAVGHASLLPADHQHGIVDAAADERGGGSAARDGSSDLCV